VIPDRGGLGVCVPSPLPGKLFRVLEMEKKAGSPGPDISPPTGRGLRFDKGTRTMLKRPRSSRKRLRRGRPVNLHRHDTVGLDGLLLFFTLNLKAAAQPSAPGPVFRRHRPLKRRQLLLRKRARRRRGVPRLGALVRRGPAVLQRV